MPLQGTGGVRNDGDKMEENTDPTDPTDPAKPEQPGKPSEQTESPQTGNNSNMMLWIGLLAASGAGAVGMTLYSRKKKEQNI